jgi:uncharacterized membrane protein YhhN
MPLFVYLIPILAVFVYALILSDFKGNRKGVYITKPISTLLVIVAALLSLTIPETTRQYTILIVVGLIFCYGGDVALMFMESKKAFLIGLILFLLGHVVYAVTFLMYGGVPGETLWISLILLIFGVLLYIYLYPGLGKMKVPVALYVLIISAMVTFATATLFSGTVPKTTAWLITLGSISFLFSDVVLAINRFRIPLKYDRLSLIPYYLGQFLIAISTYYYLS